MKKNTITLAITGASGAQYGLRLLEVLLASDYTVQLLISSAAVVVINTETGFTIPNTFQEQKEWFIDNFKAKPGQLQMHSKEDWFAACASGSSSPSSMVICPASGGTLSAIACGASNNLIERAADVAIKERRKLIVVPREAPYSAIHLENMLKLTQLGGIVVPASPGFYQNPKTINDLVDFVVARILDQLEIPNDLMSRWGEN